MMPQRNSLAIVPLPVQARTASPVQTIIAPVRRHEKKSLRTLKKPKPVVLPTERIMVFFTALGTGAFADLNSFCTFYHRLSNAERQNT